MQKKLLIAGIVLSAFLCTSCFSSNTSTFTEETQAVSSLSSTAEIIIPTEKSELSACWLAQLGADEYVFSACDASTGKYGYTNNKGEWVIPPRFDETKFAQPYAIIAEMTLLPAREGLNWGFIDRQGEWVIAPQYADAYFFEQGRAFVTTFDGISAEIDYDGNRIKNALFRAAPLVDGMGFAADYDSYDMPKTGFINEHDTWAIPPTYDLPPSDYALRPFRFSFSEGLAVVYLDEKYGAVDTSGNVKIPVQYEDLLPFTERLAAAKLGGKWGYIGTDGVWAIPPKYENAKNFTEDLAAVCIDGKWGFIDKQDNLVISSDFYIGFENEVFYLGFHEEMAPVKSGGQYGFVNKNGDLAIPFKFSHVFPFCNGLARVEEEINGGAKIGYINDKGEYVISWFIGLG